MRAIIIMRRGGGILSLRQRACVGGVCGEPRGGVALPGTVHAIVVQCQVHVQQALRHPLQRCAAYPVSRTSASKAVLAASSAMTPPTR